MKLIIQSKNSKYELRNEEGFTLIELMVVMAIIALLAAILLPSVTNFVARARLAKANADLSNLKNAMQMYRMDVGELPDRGDYYTGRGSYTSNRMGGVNNSLLENDGAGWDGPYLDEPLGLDPWGRSYLYDDNDGYGCWNSESWAASWGPNRSRETGWFPCAISTASAGGDDIVRCMFNDND